MPDALFDDLFKQADVDGDNALCLEEFASAVADMYSTPPELVKTKNENQRKAQLILDM
jgi:hypothetical protein